MRILITGGAGFIASHVADAYIEAGHEVAIVDDLSRGSEKNLNPKADFHCVDIRDRVALARVFTEIQPEIVNHHVAQIDVRRGVSEPLFDADVNILGSLNILEFATKCETKRIIYASSAGACYGDPETLPVTESHPVNPISPYGISKHTVEHYLFAFQKLYGLDYVVLRYGNVYGPRQSSKGEAGVFAIFCEQMLQGIQPTIYGDGKKIRDYVFIDDVVKANVLALDRGQGEIFNIASGMPTTDYAVFSRLRHWVGPIIEPRYADRRPGEVEKIVLDVSKAKRILGWEPEVSLYDGVKRTAEWFKEQQCR